MPSHTPIDLDGHSLRLSDVLPLSSGSSVRIPQHARQAIQESRSFVHSIASGSKAVYGINTGFGYFARQRIPAEELAQLQTNILRSHASSSGPELPAPTARLAMALRLNVLCKGLTGVRPELCDALAALINAGITPIIPCYGSVGASGDLSPLAHLALPLIGEGEVLNKGQRQAAASALKACGLAPITLAEKEGLSLINGTQIMLAISSLALARGLELLDWADSLAALSMEAMDANPSFLDERLHAARGQPGQIASAARMRAALEGSYLFDPNRSPPRVQDPYSLRCAPQVHGPSRDALYYVRGIIETELNAATDNPLVFPGDHSTVSGGNFHGQALAMAADVASIALAELGNISERRLEQLLNPHCSGLNAFLTPYPGTHSGYMAAQYLSASLVNENKLQANPAVTDSIPGNVGVEDHVSMGSTSARKLQRIIDNLERILAVEWLAAVQAIDLRRVAPLGQGSQVLYDRLRHSVPMLEEDRIIAADVAAALQLIQTRGLGAI
ncbi:MAG: histidine ammonia-lyase [Chlamydiia bacterium]|nr:histidine ammonia-lyase [Chlamydiia bacterium]